MRQSYKSMLLLFLVLIMISFPAVQSVHATEKVEEERTVAPLTLSEVSAYQEIIDKLNEEYGYSMSFAPAVFSSTNAFKLPTEYTLEEFEAELRKDIEEDIAVNAEAQEAIAALKGVEWTSAPFTGNVYTVPANVNYMSSQVTDVVYSDAVSYISDVQTTANQVEARSNEQLLTSIQPKLDPKENIVFLVNTRIGITDYWKFASVLGFSYLQIGWSYPAYVPHEMSYSLVDSNRTIAATFTCTYYNESNVIINDQATVYREFHASSDCFTNSPNYTIAKTYTNKDYNLIDDFDISQNCAGYAWNIDEFVSMDALGITYDEINNCSSLAYLSSLVKSKSMAYMANNGVSASVIRSYDTIINTTLHYRVVLRVGYDDINENGVWDCGPNAGADKWDYHWWMQLGDGSWADKRGSFPSRIVPNSNIYHNPDDILWSMWYFGRPEYSEFYSSTPAYFRITG